MCIIHSSLQSRLAQPCHSSIVTHSTTQLSSVREWSPSSVPSHIRFTLGWPEDTPRLDGSADREIDWNNETGVFIRMSTRYAPACALAQHNQQSIMFQTSSLTDLCGDSRRLVDMSYCSTLTYTCSICRRLYMSPFNCWCSRLASKLLGPTEVRKHSRCDYSNGKRSLPATAAKLLASN